MSGFLKGNFETKNRIEDTKDEVENLENRFEREAMKRLGGSIAFVAKKKVTWEIED